MLSKGGMDKRLDKIRRQEAASLKLLLKQESELLAAVEENENLVEKFLAAESQTEVKIRMEIEELTQKVELLNSQQSKVINT